MSGEGCVGAVETRIHLIQGECRVSRDPTAVLTTTLGSCVSACIHDPRAEIGGMNHFLLPDGEGMHGREAIRYGAYAMELLVNGLLRSGAKRDRLEAKLFGGARLRDGLADVGARNAAFAEQFLEREGVAYAGGSLLGRLARRIQFWPASGRVRQLTLARTIENLGPLKPKAGDQGPPEAWMLKPGPRLGLSVGF